MLKRLDLRGTGDDLASRLPRPAPPGDGHLDAVRQILREVRERGDAAVLEYTAELDGVELASTLVPAARLREALDGIDAELREAMEVARDSIADFHRTELPAPVDYARDGLHVTGRRQPVDRAGLYVPGGRAAYPSTVLMTAVPARVAGVDELVLCVPPSRDTGEVADVTLAAAALAGVDEVHSVGGAQAIAALAYGTETIRMVDVVVGPGNVYVALAKREVAGVVGVPAAFAGPSEVVVVADETTPPEFAAVDVVVQAEHGPDGFAWLISWSESTVDAVSAAVDLIVAGSPRREHIESTLVSNGYAVLVDGPQEAIAVANSIAPEHLELMNADPDGLVPEVRHAGAVFCGPWSPASIGDYLAGPSHVLPTAGTARFSGALNVEDFTKPLHVISLDREAFERVGPYVERFAEAEGLDAHAQSIRARWS
ncbi:MAG: Histidinol dehydrogenase [Acidimicrobiales bacterium]|nr:Histidinol dehydrogenase [Acidimicrobiales bacterium]